MRLSPGQLMFAVLSAVALVAAVLLASTAPKADPCAKASAGIDQERVTQAQSDYTELLKADASTGCATSGLRRVTLARCKRADRLLIGGAKAEARKDYVAILAADTAHDDPGVECAIRGLGVIEKDPDPDPVEGKRGPRGRRGPQGKPGPVVVVHGCERTRCRRW